ncbi:hypothetical protein ACFCXT_23310 [Streptomyces vinaceus]|uniref:hypothetical protein n=1 Tax=Streptomyces vinaceus TaxID=1960 RepID=UPI0035DF6C8A
MPEIWIAGHGEDADQYTFVPHRITSVRYYIGRGYYNPFQIGLGEIAADGCLDLGYEQYDGGDTYFPGDGQNVPNHRLEGLTAEQKGQLYNVLQAQGQVVIYVGEDMAMPDLIRLCTAPDVCEWPEHTCDGVLADERLHGADVRLISCRGAAMPDDHDLPQLFFDEEGMDPVVTMHDRILRQARDPRTRAHAMEELDALSEATKAMVLGVSPQIQNCVRQYEADVERMRTRRVKGWFDPAKNTRSGVWAKLRAYKESPRNHSLATFVLGAAKVPEITVADCPSSYAHCRSPAWERDFQCWFYGPFGGNRTVMRALECADSAAARAVCALAREGRELSYLPTANSVVRDFVDEMAARRVSEICPGEGLVDLLEEVNTNLGRAFEWETLASPGTDPGRHEPGDPRIRLLADAALAAEAVVEVLRAWQEHTAQEFRDALVRLGHGDLEL